MSNEIVELLGKSELIITPVVLGQSLNIWALRGFAPLDELASISIADIANDLTNQRAPQRSPDSTHAREAFDYAIASVDGEETASVSFFPEVILNVRTPEVLSVFDSEHGAIDFSSMTGPSEDSKIVSLTFDLSKIDRSPEKPSVSTVDGNHRLVKAFEARVQGQDIEFPIVSFAILVGLTPIQEGILFRDLNGKHKGMNASHLAALGADIDPPEILLRQSNGQANWFAHELLAENRPFHKMVRRYANTKIFKDRGEAPPPVALKSLMTGVKRTLGKSDWIKAKLWDSTISDAELINRANAIATGMSYFWFAVKKNFPLAWQDKKNYILLQTIGISAFSSLAAVVIDRAVKETKLSQADMDAVLKHVAEKVNLEKEKWPGVSGPAGAEQVFNALFQALDEDRDLTDVLAAWGHVEPSPLDE